jgi:hypothetical protein
MNNAATQSKIPAENEKTVIPSPKCRPTNVRETPNEIKPAKRSAMLTPLGILARRGGSDAIPLRVINLGCAEERGLRFDLRTVAYNHDLRVR